jgi:hypothetical protein
MKKIKIIWPQYHKDCLGFVSPTNSWINATHEPTADITIYIDQINVPNDSIVMLVEPHSIHPNHYEQILSRANQFKSILSYDYNHFKSLQNFVHIPPPFGSWINGQDRNIYTKTKNISFIASTKLFCNEHRYRQEIVNFYQDKVDVYGRGRKEINTKLEGLRDYRFSICMENCITDLYYTEKILDCFLTGTIPIFWGTNEIKKIFDERGIIFLDDVTNNKIKIEDLTEEFYNSKKEYIIKNFEIANKLKNSVPNSIDHYVKTLNGQ